MRASQVFRWYAGVCRSHPAPRQQSVRLPSCGTRQPHSARRSRRPRVLAEPRELALGSTSRTGRPPMCGALILQHRHALQSEARFRPCQPRKNRRCTQGSSDVPKTN